MIPQQEITVRTGSRLHFGLWAWGPGHAQQFGGVGMMIDEPQVGVRLTPADQFKAIGPLAKRLERVAARCGAQWTLDELPRCQIETIQMPRQHTGLGVGTQLSLAAVRGLADWLGRGDVSTSELARVAGRGVRSAVGTHGFLHGGLIVDAGKRGDEPLGELACRIAVPVDWRVVLLTPRDVQGKAGAAERAAFAQLSEVPVATTELLQRLAYEELAPAIEQRDFDRFAAAVYDYGHHAGRCFEPVQGGAYSTVATSRLVDLLRSHGVQGVGQSSWGPTVFAFTPNANAANEVLSWLAEQPSLVSVDVVVTQAKNEGATIHVA